MFGTIFIHHTYRHNHLLISKWSLWFFIILSSTKKKQIFLFYPVLSYPDGTACVYMLVRVQGYSAKKKKTHKMLSMLETKFHTNKRCKHRLRWIRRVNQAYPQWKWLSGEMILLYMYLMYVCVCMFYFTIWEISIFGIFNFVFLAIFFWLVTRKCIECDHLERIE